MDFTAFYIFDTIGSGYTEDDICEQHFAQKARDRIWDLDVYGRIILKWVWIETCSVQGLKNTPYRWNDVENEINIGTEYCGREQQISDIL
jgi:hypothetical protein